MVACTVMVKPVQAQGRVDREAGQLLGYVVDQHVELVVYWKVWSGVRRAVSVEVREHLRQHG